MVDGSGGAIGEFDWPRENSSKLHSRAGSRVPVIAANAIAQMMGIKRVLDFTFLPAPPSMQISFLIGTGRLLCERDHV